MLTAYALEGSVAASTAAARLTRCPLPVRLEAAEGLLWIDLLEPTLDEERSVEALLGIDVPTREEMREIESSNRLYEENGAVYLTWTIITKLDSDQPQNSQVTFILKDGRLVTNRYSDPLPFKRFAAHLEKQPVGNNNLALLAGLVEFVINRIADVIERVGSNLENTSNLVFANRDSRGRRQARRDFRQVLESIGQSGEIISKTRESLASLGRVLAFVQQSSAVNLSPDSRTRLRVLSRDVLSMGDYASFLGNNVAFLLDATLGMINIDQNNILKIFSVMTVLLLPPSVVGAIYGMNFGHIPYADQTWGFLAALGVMVVSSLGPYLLFKRRGWL